MLPCRDIFAGSATVLLHRWFTLRRARHTRVAQLFKRVIPDGTCEIRRLILFIFTGAVYHKALTNCATRVCRACLEVADLCSRTLSVTLRIGCERHGRKNPSAVPLFRSGHISAICARLSTGKVGVQRGRKTAGCPSFLPTAVGTASPPRRVPRRSRRPQTANPPLRFSENLPARKGRTRLRQFAHPAGSVQKRSRSVRANTLTQFVCPAHPVPKSPADASCTGI